MNKIMKLLLMMFLSSTIAAAQHGEHIQDIHKYITYQAWELVKAQYPGVVNSVMNPRIGHWQDGNLNGTGPWQKGNIVTGAYREDEEDVIYGYPFPYTSATHFWDADLGDNSGFYPPPFNQIYENAYKKIQSYWTGRDRDRNWLEIGPFFYNLIPYYIRVKYDSLHNAYKDHSKFIVTHWLDIGTGFWYEENPPMPMVPFLVKNSNSYSFQEGEALAKRICWEIVGRMCHLIEDSGVPAHAHNDIHLFGDYFETTYIPQVYSNFTWSDALLQGGLVNINQKAYPLRYAMYTTNQIADRFSSDDFDGDENVAYPSYYSGENYEQQISPVYQQITAAGVSNSTPPQVHAQIAARTAFVYTIRSVAGFLWYVYNKFGITSDSPPRITGFDYSLPDQFIFNGETLELTCNTIGNNLTYEWLVRACDTSNLCNSPIPGLQITTHGNKIRIYNNSFRNNWTCLKYDSLCMSGGSLSAPDPLHLYVGVRISNLAGSDTKFYNMNQRVSIHPNHFLRPGPYSGCPFLLIKNNNGFVYENNVLHKSEFPENKDKDITDKLVLKNVPEINTGDSTITLAIDENSIDRSYFDNFRLVSIDHPSNTIAAVTNSNELVILDASQISSPIVAEHEGVDVTDILQYDTADSKSVEGLTKNQMQAKFSAAFQTSDSIAIIFDASPPPKFVIPVVKDIAGEITAQDEYGGLNNIPINFAMRQLSSPVIVPVSAGANIVSAYMNWKRDFNISYFSCVPIRYSGFSQSENELVYAQDIVAGNILQLLKHEDNVYAELDSTTSIILKFKVNLLQPPAGMKRSYMLVSTGRYEKPAGYNSQHLNSNTEITLDENSLEEVELLPNIPNPFNPVTLIRFNLPQESNAEVSVYDITGKVVANIFQGKLTKGMHRFTFDGSTLSSGAYYVRLKTEKRSLVRKMMLVK